MRPLAIVLAVPIFAACASPAGHCVVCKAVCAVLPARAEPPPPPPPPEPTPAPAPPPPAPALAPARIVLRGVNFAFDSAELDGVSAVVLNVALEALQSRPEVRVRIEGHTDSIGSESYNQGLSERRAEAVKRYLVEQGIGAWRLEARGFGESRPIAANDTEDGRSLNRRVELVPLD